MVKKKKKKFSEAFKSKLLQVILQHENIKKLEDVKYFLGQGLLLKVKSVINVICSIKKQPPFKFYLC